jgi:two-component system cell cycle response regulator
VKILVIEDTPELLELLAIILRSAGHEAITANNGVEGLTAARSDLPDLIIADLEMPLMDGFELLRHLRADPRLAQRPVIALTACAMLGDRERVLAAGFSGYLSKPIRAKELVPQIAAIISDLATSPAQA